MKYFSDNIFNLIPPQLSAELSETILQEENIRIERIVSKGHTTPADEWYDQHWNEWVLLLQGDAKLLFEDNSSINLVSGDYLLIPAHTRHRVEWTDPDEECIWLAIHIQKS